MNIEEVKDQLTMSYSEYQIALKLNITEDRLKMVENVVDVQSFINCECKLTALIIKRTQWNKAKLNIVPNMKKK